ncbi:MAG: AlkA N-terminal domain-containing protein [Acidimicrobiales bacterium]
MHEDFERCYRALQSRDQRFDGWFVTAVTSTGVYCRPSCPARTPRPSNVRFFADPAAAQAAGFRACLRCRPDAAPGSPEWRWRTDVAARAMRLIADGVVDREGVDGLAGRLGYSRRQLQRVLVAEVGTGPLALARAQRAQTARLLLQTTALAVAEVAFAAGFESVRQFNDTVRAVFAMTPTELRRRGERPERRQEVAAAGTGEEWGQEVHLRLACRRPFAGRALVDFLALRAVGGVEEVDGATYRRSLALPHGPGVVGVEPEEGAVRVQLRLADVRDLAAAVSGCRRLLDLDADPVAVDEALGADGLLGRLVRRTPGRRLPSTVDGAELAVRGVLGQQVSLAGARALTARLVVAAGTPLPAPVGTLTHLFPSPEQLLALHERHPGAFAVPAARRRTLVELCGALASGRVVVGPGTDPAELDEALGSLPGIGPWTVAYVKLRGLGHPDAFLPTDLGVRRALDRLGVPSDPSGAATVAERWRPWRSYALVHLWAHRPTDRRTDRERSAA